MLKPYALFDFDGTLIRGDSIVRLCFYAAKKKMMSLPQLLCAGTQAALYLCRMTTAVRSKQAALSFLKGKTQQEMREFAEDFCRDVLSKKLYRDGAAEMKKHKKAGAEVWLVSASPAFYLEPLRQYLPITGVIGTRVHMDENGVFTGLIAGENCRGYEKPLRLAEVLASRGDMIEYADSWAYGDTAGDAPMLALCGHKVAVNPRKKLMKELANADGVTAVRWKCTKEASR